MQCDYFLYVWLSMSQVTYTYNSRNFVFKIEKSTNAYKNVKLNLEALASNHDQIGKYK